LRWIFENREKLEKGLIKEIMEPYKEELTGFLGDTNPPYSIYISQERI